MSVLQTVTGKRPKLIGTDLDGTIVAHYGFISERTKISFAAAHAAGIEIYFVTGRPIRWMVEIKENFNFGLGICANGAMLYDFINWLRSIFGGGNIEFCPKSILQPTTQMVQM